MLIFLIVLAVIGSILTATILFVFTGRDRSLLFGRSLSITVDGASRSFLVSQGGDQKPRNLVLGLHGYGGDGRQLAYYTALHNAFGSDTMVVYPNASAPIAGQKTGWNADFCCGSGWKNKVDDVGFLQALITDLRQRHGIAADRVFIVGFSNGAFMAQRFAAEHPELAIMPIDRRSCSYENGVVGWADVVSLWRLEPVTSLTREPRALCSVAMSTYLSFF
jgi:poly(3-hydroxybutyrate) depolymerase